MYLIIRCGCLGGHTDSNRNNVWSSSASNDSIDTALSLSLTSNGNDDFSSDTFARLIAGEQDFYRIKLPAGSYLIETNSNINTTCTLYNNAQIQIAYDDNDGTGNNCQIIHENSNLSDRYLRIQGKNSSTIGGYQLLIKRTPTTLAQRIGRNNLQIISAAITRGNHQTAKEQSASNGENSKAQDREIKAYGRLEVIHNGKYGTICGDSFDDTDALVACRELGYKGGYRFPAEAVQDGTGQILLDDLHCTGTEKRLLDCQHNGVGIHNCQHSEDIGVACY